MKKQDKYLYKDAVVYIITNWRDRVYSHLLVIISEPELILSFKLKLQWLERQQQRQRYYTCTDQTHTRREFHTLYQAFLTRDILWPCANRLKFDYQRLCTHNSLLVYKSVLYILSLVWYFKPNFLSYHNLRYFYLVTVLVTIDRIRSTPAHIS